VAKASSSAPYGPDPTHFDLRLVLRLHRRHSPIPVAVPSNTRFRLDGDPQSSEEDRGGSSRPPWWRRVILQKWRCNGEDS
jgi:hypothetical protein